MTWKIPRRIRKNEYHLIFRDKIEGSKQILHSITDVIWARECLQYIITFSEHGSLLIYDRLNPELLIIEIQMISHSGRTDGRRGKSKHVLPSIRIIDDELGFGILEYDRQWSIFSLKDLILWGMGNKRSGVDCTPVVS